MSQYHSVRDYFHLAVHGNLDGLPCTEWCVAEEGGIYFGMLSTGFSSHSSLVPQSHQNGELVEPWRYAQRTIAKLSLAEGVGFEPTRAFAHTLSKRAPLAARPSLQQNKCKINVQVNIHIFQPPKTIPF